MGEAKRQTQSTDSTYLEDWDRIFLGIMQDLYGEIITCARENVVQILDLSKNFLEKDTHKSLKEFHDLYFGSAAQDSKTEAYNKDVSDFVDQLQDKLAAGEDISAVKAGHSAVLQRLQASEEDRLQISQFQKQMESLIVLDSSLKDKLSPVLASMQFEDLMRQRLEHLLRGYELINTLEASPSNETLDKVVDELDDLCSSQSETQEFYEEVKQEPAPTDIKQQGSIIEF